MEHKQGGNNKGDGGGNGWREGGREGGKKGVRREGDERGWSSSLT